MRISQRLCEDVSSIIFKGDANNLKFVNINKILGRVIFDMYITKCGRFPVLVPVLLFSSQTQITQMTGEKYGHRKTEGVLLHLQSHLLKYYTIYCYACLQLSSIPFPCVLPDRFACATRLYLACADISILSRHSSISYFPLQSSFPMLALPCFSGVTSNDSCMCESILYRFS